MPSTSSGILKVEACRVEISLFNLRLIFIEVLVL